MALEVDEDLAVGVPLPPRPIIYSEDSYRRASEPTESPGAAVGVFSTRSKVSALASAAMPNSRARRAPAPPPKATLISSRALVCRLVRREWAAAVPGRRSQTIRRKQISARHRRRAAPGCGAPQPARATACRRDGPPLTPPWRGPSAVRGTYTAIMRARQMRRSRRRSPSVWPTCRLDAEQAGRGSN